MSASAILVPLAISMIASAITPSKAKKQLAAAQQQQTGICLETSFNDTDLLLKTLQEHGVPVVQEAEDRFVTQLDDATIVYRRLSADGPFVMDIGDLGDIACLMDELDCIENEYNGNVQTYTYERVMNNLPEDMVVESEEVMEDNSIMITLTVG